MAGMFCLLLSQGRQTRNSLLLCPDWGTKIVLPLFRKRCQPEVRREKDFLISLYSGLLQGKELILYQLLKKVAHALSALSTQVLAVELEDQCSAANSLLMPFKILIITLSMMSLFLFGGRGVCVKKSCFYSASFSQVFQWLWTLTTGNTLLMFPFLKCLKQRVSSRSRCLKFSPGMSPPWMLQ